jgi:myb proto-oncogene protein
VLDPSIDPTMSRTRKWTADEDVKLKYAVRMHGGQNWKRIAALVPGRARKGCFSRWQTILDTNIDPTTARAGRWTADEDKKLNHAFLTHGSKDWATITALVPGRTKVQCQSRWYHVLNPSINRGSGRTGRWTAVEDGKLKDAVQTHGGKNWGAIAALVPGRTKIQCNTKWHDGLAVNIDPTTALARKWTAEEEK